MPRAGDVVGKLGMSPDKYRVLGGSDKNILKIDCANGFTVLNIPNVIELYTLNWLMASYVNYISIQLF